MAFLRAKEDEDIQFQMAPMIDVVFLLLIFFLIATSFLNPETHIITNLPKKELRLETEDLPTQYMVVVTSKGLKEKGKPISKRAFLRKVGRAMAGGEDAYVFIDSTDDARNQDVIEIMDALEERGAKFTVVPPYEEEKD